MCTKLPLQLCNIANAFGTPGQPGYYCSAIAKYFIIHLISEQHVFSLASYECQKLLVLLFVSCHAIVNYFTLWENKIHPQFLKFALVSPAQH